MASSKNKKLPAPELGELAAVGGEDIGAAYAGELRVPDEGVLRARGGSDLGLYEKVLRDPEVYSTFQQRRVAVTSREWYVEPGGTASIDVAAADHLRANLKRLPWDAITKRMLMGVFNGFSVGEGMLGVDADNKYVFTGIKVRRARRFRFDRNSNLRLVTRDAPQGKLMPLNKFWVFRAAPDDDDDPYGLGLAPLCYWPVWFKRNGFRHWATFLEHFSGPTPVAKVPPGTKPEDLQKLIRMLGDIKTNGRLAVPNNVALEMLQALRSSGGDFHVFCEYMDLSIDKIVLSQTMTTNDGSSKSQAEVHGGVKLEVIKSDADMLSESFNSGPATWLTEWNFPGAEPPRMWRKVEDPADLDKQATRDKTIFDMGYAPTEKYIRETYGDGFVPRPKENVPPSAVVTDPGETRAEFAEPPAAPVVGPARAVVEKAIEGDEWRPLLGPEVTALEELLGDCADLEEARDRLGELAQRNPDAITESLARVMFAAKLAGEAGAGVDGDD